MDDRTERWERWERWELGRMRRVGRRLMTFWGGQMVPYDKDTYI